MPAPVTASSPRRTPLVLAALVLAGVAAVVLTAARPAGSRAAVARPRLAGASTSDVTSNWAGYSAVGPGSSSTSASTSFAFTDVTGQWREPKATCTPGRPTSVAIWVGLGGYSIDSTALEQAGTSADCSASGQASYYVWYELVPADSVTVSLKIGPGDVITSSVVVNGTDVLVQVIDRTRRTRFTKHLTMASPDLTSAEWIAEAPAQCSSGGFCRQVELTNFGSVTFTRSFAKGDGVGGTISSTSWIATALRLVPRAHRFFGERTDTSTGGAGAHPSALVPSGEGFTVTWDANPRATTNPAPASTGM